MVVENFKDFKYQTGSCSQKSNRACIRIRGKYSLLNVRCLRGSNSAKRQETSPETTLEENNYIILVNDNQFCRSLPPNIFVV